VARFEIAAARQRSSDIVVNVSRGYRRLPTDRREAGGEGSGRRLTAYPVVHPRRGLTAAKTRLASLFETDLPGEILQQRAFRIRRRRDVWHLHLIVSCVADEGPGGIPALHSCELQAFVWKERAAVDAGRRAELSGSDRDPNPNEAMWRAILDGTDPVYARNRGRLKHLPGTPRCKMCAAPFGGPASILMRWRGRAPWPNNPDYCRACFQLLDRYHGGAEIESSFLFADIRGSTTLAEGMSPTGFRTLLDRFYDVAARVLVAHDGIVDKFVGDEVVGIFIPALAHDEHPAKAIAAARALLEATGNGDSGERWLPVGVGVGTGTAFVGSVGETHTAAMTALGDIVNVTARLASAAGPGEILVNDRAAEQARLDTRSLELRRLELKGKTQLTTVYVVHAGRGSTS
jgi:adenylate cyclase